MTTSPVCLNCGKKVYYSVDDVWHMHEGGGGIWCDAVRYEHPRGYVDAKGNVVGGVPGARMVRV